MMQSMGFKNVADLTGGVAAWTGQLEKGAATLEGRPSPPRASRS